ncbi:MAG TPA: FtsW/RodA/SpoVE family cell cycle protein [Thermodesulfobacteriota bacterium]|nr:FtsW/RodA/SpoVE family cell cycle protein [Candidatus Paceibacterota bacterium]HVY55653.1 FtsW/RodA/SpoVE family cell cycle protein [Thermodesulfobacteriota bacterium]
MVDMIKSAGERIAKGGIDWMMFGAAVTLALFGLVTMNSFIGDNYYFSRQIIWLCVAVAVFFGTSFIDWSFLRRTNVLVTLYCAVIAVLGFLLLAAREVKGAQSWLHFGAVSFEPMDAAKLVLVFVLAKYFSRRHVEIANIRHILVSGAYTAILFILIALQPDFGSAMIVGCLWLGMALVSGLSKKHLAILFSCAVIAFTLLWNFGFQEYQKLRVLNFVHPTADVQGTGYNARQSTIAVGSGEILGKGIGYGTQSKLKFLPEYQTDFIFAAFAEEWGFIGVIIFFGVFGVLVWRIIANARRGVTNFEIFYGLGLAVLFMSHFFINVGMNMGMLPVTGITLPFVSYGGSHLLTSFFALGILQSYRKSMRAAHREETKNEFLGI